MIGRDCTERGARRGGRGAVSRRCERGASDAGASVCQTVRGAGVWSQRSADNTSGVDSDQVLLGNSKFSLEVDKSLSPTFVTTQAVSSGSRARCVE